MKWLIISTVGKNPGDEFIRVGLLNVIKSVDPKALISIIDKETSDILNPIDFDKCIWAGMPVFWSLGSNSSWSGVHWWKVLSRGWVSEDSSKFCILGAGSFQDWTNVTRGLDASRMKAEALLLMKRSYSVVARDSVVRDITQCDIPVRVCPAILATRGLEKTTSIKGCNLMPHGAHYADFNPYEAQVWVNKQQDIATSLINNDFTFFAHSDQEYTHALSLGWKSEDIIRYTGEPIEFLKHYRNVDKFFGNRVHGCIVARGVGADVISCGYDSRQEAVRQSGATVTLPSELDLDKLETWCSSEERGEPFDLEREFDWYKKHITDFMDVKNANH